MTQNINRRDLFAVATGAAATAVVAAAGQSQPAAAAAVSAPTIPTRGLPAPAQPVVEISTGKVRGIENAGVRSFKGIPYGAPTFGKNRFMPPQPAEAWASVRESIVYGPGCPGASGGGAANTPSRETPEDAFLLYRLGGRSHEDCLRLNVWAPNGNGNGKRPVLVYMHGGGYSFGSGSGLLAYDGENMARRGDAVVVTHNHRLNIFGYLDLSSYGGKWAQSTNLGMQDIVLALQWVRANISQFGGDPNNVTVFGQSGGGGKILSLMAMPSAKGLFHKAIIESGPNGSNTTPTEAAANTKATLAKIGIAENALDKIADLSTEAVGAGFAGGRWGPVIDGKVIVSKAAETATLPSGIPMIVGSNLNELTNAVDNPKAAGFNDAALMAAATEKYKAAGADIVAAYKKAWPKRDPIEIWHAMEAYGMRSGSFALADKKFAVDGKVWQYLFTWNTPMLEGRPKTFHSAEIAFVSDNAALCVNQTGGGPAALKLAGQMCDAWLALARNGDPNHSGMPKWPAFDKSHPVMAFDDPAGVVNDPEAEGRKLILAAAAKRDTASR